MAQPTPDFSHLKSPAYRDVVYEPAEDSFLLMDALQQEASHLNNLRPLICLEVGSGNGVILTFLKRLLHAPSFSWAVDINVAACKCSLETLSMNKVSSNSDAVAMDLVDPMKERLRNQVDVLVFNPPYVVTPSEEVGNHGIEASWAGGVNGREVIDRFLACVPDLLSSEGVFYLVVIKENKPVEICSLLANYGLKNETILSRKAGNEALSVIRFNK